VPAEASESRRIGGGSLAGVSESRRAWCQGCWRTGEQWPKRRPEDWRWPGRRSPGHDGRGVAGRRVVHVGEGRGIGVSVRRAGGEHRTVGAWVRSAGGGRAGHGDVDLSHVREREGHERTMFFV
jgi:hypothetical protein